MHLSISMISINGNGSNRFLFLFVFVYFFLFVKRLDTVVFLAFFMTVETFPPCVKWFQRCESEYTLTMMYSITDLTFNKHLLPLNNRFFSSIKFITTKFNLSFFF